MPRSYFVALLVLLGAGAVTARGAEEPAPLIRPDKPFEEKVEVRLVELKLLVSDRSGRPVTDLKPEDIEVLEDKVPQRLAYLERLTSREHDLRTGGDAPPPAVAYSRDGAGAPDRASAVLPATPVRRILFAFDVRNSKINVRESWKAGALRWMRENMREDDRAGVVLLTNYVQWILPFTGDRGLLAQVLEGTDLEGSAPNRDRRRDVTLLVDQLRSLCAEPARGKSAGSPMQIGVTAGNPRAAAEEAACGYRLAEASVAQWETDSRETIGALRALVGQVAAVPGQKMVILFSEGILADPAQAGVDAMLSVFGAQNFDVSRTKFDLSRDVDADVRALHDAATGADVVFFGLDTRSGAERGRLGNIEDATMPSAGALGVDPWTEMYEATRGTLDALATATGGRLYAGKDKLADHVRLAADSYLGIYALGYYRAGADGRAGRLRVEVKRRRVRVEYADAARPRGLLARFAALDVSVGPPLASGNGDRQWLPVELQVPYSAIPLRAAGDTYGCVVGLFLQAIRPDGAIAGEAFESVTVAFDRRGKDRARSEALRHRLKVELPPGPYRLRARLSDDRQEILGDRTLDLTLRQGAVVGGIGNP